ncbi:MAG: mechanosensitive ion channel family protein [Thermoplasmata archaeon]
MHGSATWFGVTVLQAGSFLDTPIPLLGLTVWQLLLLIFIGVGIVVAGLAVRAALVATFRRTPFPEDMERRVARTSFYLVIIVGLLFVPIVFGINLGTIDVFGFSLTAILTAVVLAIVFYLASNIVSGVLSRVFQRTEYPEELEKSLVSASRLIVYIVGVFVVFAALGMDLTALLLSLGAFSIALSFALADIIKNVTAGLLVQADKPFFVGDTIKVGGVEGRVVKTKIRMTVLETAEGHTAYIPNLWFMTKEIINKTRGQGEAPPESEGTSES